MSKGGGGAPSPDPQIGAAALKQAQTGEQWLQYATDQAAIANKRQAGVDKLANQVTTTQLGLMKDQAGVGARGPRALQDRLPAEGRRIHQEGQRVGLGGRAG